MSTVSATAINPHLMPYLRYALHCTLLLLPLLLLLLSRTIAVHELQAREARRLARTRRFNKCSKCGCTDTAKFATAGATDARGQVSGA